MAQNDTFVVLLFLTIIYFVYFRTSNDTTDAEVENDTVDHSKQVVDELTEKYDRLVETTTETYEGDINLDQILNEWSNFEHSQDERHVGPIVDENDFPAEDKDSQELPLVDTVDKADTLLVDTVDETYVDQPLPEEVFQHVDEFEREIQEHYQRLETKSAKKEVDIDLEKNSNQQKKTIDERENTQKLEL